ncbi:saccharopine dehydrogenase [Phaffia rhodozyma]|uniref:Saccharopine dehydrogenase [NAD(+), L-lysine-forming] n=1 Tax=Phaffia rhodozyma TaxID=264483 RepID=A0A0F7SHI1_PHARH|nr:saccharopine dehydrogenase [Phaffia rhodozyma]
MSSSVKPSFWLRCETKPHEHRSALTPTTAKALLDAGFDITVERDPQRIFDDEEFSAVGCKLVATNSWKTDCPLTTPVLGLKELEESTDALPQTHVQFAHCYKHQAGWSDVLKRFRIGGGTLYDLEFLTDANGRRVAAFGFHAGFAGAAAGCLAVGAQQSGGRLGGLKPFKHEGDMVEQVKSELAKLGRPVRALVIGALGRCGSGAVDLFRKVGLKEDDILKWDMKETAGGGPFAEFLDVDIIVNCIYLTEPIPHFLTEEYLNKAGQDRKLACVVDVSCDTTNPNNPLPIYSINTVFPEPTVDVKLADGLPALTVISIDHLPTLLPRESSESFSTALLPSLLAFPQRSTEGVWTRAEELFKKHSAEAKEVNP